MAMGRPQADFIPMRFDALAAARPSWAAYMQWYGVGYIGPSVRPTHPRAAANEAPNRQPARNDAPNREG